MVHSSDAERRFETIVAMLEARLRHLLHREGQIGSTMPFTGKSRMGDDELRERFMRLRRSADEFLRKLHRAMADHPRILDFQKVQRWVGEAEASLRVDRLSVLSGSEIEQRLETAWFTLEAILNQIESARQVAGAQTDPVFLQLTSEEIRALTAVAPDDPEEPHDVGSYPPEIIERLICLGHLHDMARHCVSETRAILAGRFHYTGGRGRPHALRGSRLAAELLGMAEGLGLCTTRDHDAPAHSAADAAVAALKRCEDMDKPGARSVLAEMPATYATLARRLWPKCKEGEELFPYRYLGKVLGDRMRHRT